MDFDYAVKTINKLLIEKRPDTFNSSWILKHAPNVYQFIQENVRAEIGGIDWDRVTRALDRRFQRKWMASSRNRTNLYRKKAEVGVILKKYHTKLYAGEDTLNFLFKRGSGPYREEGVLYVLFLDIRLPGISGIEVLRQVKKDTWVNEIPVIMLSVSDIPEKIEQCRRLGCDNYFVKQTMFKKFSLTVEQVGQYINNLVLPEIAKA